MNIMEENGLEEVRKLLRSLIVAEDHCSLAAEKPLAADNPQGVVGGYVCRLGKDCSSYKMAHLASPLDNSGPYCLRLLAPIETLKRYVVLKKFVYNGKMSVPELKRLYERNPSIVFEEL